jgi:hypothetical protein
MKSADGKSGMTDCTGVLFILGDCAAAYTATVKGEFEAAEQAAVPTHLVFVDEKDDAALEWRALLAGTARACLCVVSLRPGLQRRIERSLWPRCLTTAPRVSQPPNLCIATYSSSTSEAQLEELRCLVWALRRQREPLFVVVVEALAGGPEGCQPRARPRAKPWHEDLFLETEEKGYDVLPFLSALNFVRRTAGIQLGPYVTKIHSKTDDQWRRALFKSTYVRPEAPCTLLASRACVARFDADPADVNFQTWMKLWELGVLRQEPKSCDFVAGTVFTAQIGAMSELADAVEKLRPHCTAARSMARGSDGQAEHALERCMGLLCTSKGARVCCV